MRALAGSTLPIRPPARLACWSHARRKLYDVHLATASPIAKELLEQIAALFATAPAASDAYDEP